MSVEYTGVEHKIIVIAGQKLVAEIAGNEIIKTWQAGERSETVIKASADLKKPNPAR